MASGDVVWENTGLELHEFHKVSPGHVGPFSTPGMSGQWMARLIADSGPWQNPHPQMFATLYGNPTVGDPGGEYPDLQAGKQYTIKIVEV